ncbi:MAG TPA: PQQ-dependent sugar dehydrogenase [Tepidisphaeraceae bacterium]|nr:PQQ-dependent sugar dehydrogenase [Tepidisphaeraceae bacterium]
MHGTPESPDPFLAERLFPKIKFYQPLDIEFAPGGNRVFVVEQTGKIYSFPNVPDSEKADLLVDISKANGLDKIKKLTGINVYGLAFDPDFQKNHYCYICYALAFPSAPAREAVAINRNGSRLSRFMVSDADPPTIDLASETSLLQWEGGGHNGGCVKFGPDGDLYLSTGDNGDPNPPDPFNIGQNVGDLRSKILRIDVRHSSADQPYVIPADNPFVNMPGARGEVFCYGLRNPWRMNFDRATGNLWVGDVGWELWESVVCAQSGGNYGWSILEGPNPVHPTGPRGPTPITPPLIALPHTESDSLTGGIVYHGKRLPALQNQYIFGDWETRRVWGAPCKGKTLGKYGVLAQTQLRVVAFGEDADGEMYIVDYEGGGIWRLAPNPASGRQSDFPRKLSETGLFKSVLGQVPNTGVIPFAINSPQWVDGAVGEHFVALASAENISDDYKENKRIFPKGMVLARTLSLELAPGNAATRKKLETQLLHFDGRQWHGYSYAWNDEQSDAALVDGGGLDKPLHLNDPAAPGGKRLQTWHYPSRAQCMTCHTSWTGYALAFNEAQIDRDARFAAADGHAGAKTGAGGASGANTSANAGTIVDGQLRAFRHVGLLPYPKPPEPPKPGEPPPAPEVPIVLADPYNAKSSLDSRARSYLHVNCSVCHRFGGGGAALIDLRENITLDETKLLTAPMLGAFEILQPRIVCAGDESRSVLYYRMAKSGAGHMPHMGATLTDERGLELIRQWIDLQKAAEVEHPDAGGAPPAAEQAVALQALKSGADSAAAMRVIDALLATTNGALKLVALLDSGKIAVALRDQIIHRGLAAPRDSVRDLFIRYVPPDPNQAPKLGANPNIEKLLALPGDIERGKNVFFQTAGGLCSKCHIVNHEGLDFGPDLTKIGMKYAKADLLDNIMHPSKTIAAGYQTYAVQKKDGEIISGFMVSQTDDEMVIKDAQRKLIHIAKADVSKSKPLAVSAMPEGLLADLDARQAADLLAFLASLK